MFSRKQIVTIVCTALTISAFSQRIYVEGTKLMMNGKPIYMNGCNTPWDKWNDFGGNYDSTFWEAEFARFETYGINSTRIWISCNGEVDPQITESGKITGASAAFWQHCDDLMARATKHKIYIMASMMSFDHTKDANKTFQAYRNMLASAENVQTYIDNYLIPFVERYKDNPYLFNIDLCNEPEWMNQNAEEGKLPWAQLQRYAAMCAAAIHKSQSKVTVSLGSAAIKWGSNVKTIQGATGSCEDNMWSDANLQAQFNDSQAYLDIWQVHYYEWINQYFSNPFETGPIAYNINDRPCIVGEMPGRATLLGVTWITTMLQSFEAIQKVGYQGHYPWTSNSAGAGDFGSLSTFGDASLAFKNANKHLVFPDKISSIEK